MSKEQNLNTNNLNINPLSKPKIDITIDLDFKVPKKFIPFIQNNNNNNFYYFIKEYKTSIISEKVPVYKTLLKNIFKYIIVPLFVLIIVLFVVSSSYYSKLISNLFDAYQTNSNAELIQLGRSSGNITFAYIPDPLIFIYYLLTVILSPFLIFLVIISTLKILSKMFEIRNGKKYLNPNLIRLGEFFGKTYEKNLNRILDISESEQNTIFNNYINSYILLDHEKKRFSGKDKQNNYYFHLKALDPDWELNYILFGFLKQWTLISFLGFIGSILLLAQGLLILASLLFFYSSTIGINNIGDLVMILFLVGKTQTFYSDVIVFVLFGVIGVVYYVVYYWKDTFLYIKIKNQISEELQSRILALSTDLSLIYQKNQNVSNIGDIKLDILSYRASLEYLKNLPKFPFFDRFKWITFTSVFISILSFILPIFHL